MSAFEDLEKALGIDLSDPDQALAHDLVEEDHALLEELVRIRREVAQMSATEVADRMGRHRSVVTNFEKLTADPHLSTIRRYAHAIGARITHHVEWVDPRGQGQAAPAEPAATETSQPGPEALPSRVVDKSRRGHTDAVRMWAQRNSVSFTTRSGIDFNAPASVQFTASSSLTNVLIESRTGR
ncbi:helix-turn-helix domain-containing protein [Nocardia amikacinitolerans]|uniref:helix-turn-helix domain-containing protein n=1 Tax=Nocardia amikacinitolerans TaxID=756689 RepID=UPI0012ED382E|nr:helix-turn-helix transcriptional regulator [Nocardia amikacinitolerans]